VVADVADQGRCRGGVSVGGGCVVDSGLIWVCWWTDLGFPDTVQDLLGLLGILMGLLGMFNGFAG